MRYLIFSIWVVISLTSYSCKDAKAKHTINEVETNGGVWKLEWSDEFAKEGLPSLEKWEYQVGDGCPNLCGWGNNELQYYTKSDPSNARVEGGKLIIEVHKDDTRSSGYSSAKLVTKGKKTWNSGRIEVRAKLPTGLGTWPAIWMMPETDKYGGWPRSGEIDIMEHVGYCPDSIFGTVHTEAFNHMIGTQKVNQIQIKDSESEFHNYGIIWNKEKIEWFIDGERYHVFENEHKSYKEWPFDHPFYLILNVAVGGNWGGKHGVAKDIWPQKMEIEYVRAYELIN